MSTFALLSAYPKPIEVEIISFKVKSYPTLKLCPTTLVLSAVVCVEVWLFLESEYAYP